MNLINGTVIGLSGNKTINVITYTPKCHKKYKKIINFKKKFKVHNDKFNINIGDKILFSHCRPISKTKKWIIHSIVNKSKQI